MDVHPRLAFLFVCPSTLIIVLKGRVLSRIVCMIIDDSSFVCKADFCATGILCARWDGHSMSSFGFLVIYVLLFENDEGV